MENQTIKLERFKQAVFEDAEKQAKLITEAADKQRENDLAQAKIEAQSLPDSKSRLATFKASRDYKFWLKEKAEKCKQTYPEHNGVIYLSPEDMKYASDLADFEVKSRDSIELGGMLMVYEDMGIALDYTFDSAFEGQRSAFTEKAELVLG